MGKRRLSDISDEQKKICEEFASRCVDTNIGEYKKRNQNNKEKVQQDIYYGKVAEFMVYNYMIKEGKECTLPDVEIYSKKKKSFDADLKVSSNEIHVKSCLNSSNFPNSWLFQPYDPLVENPKETDFLALCVIGEIPYFYFLPSMKMTYEEPVKKSLNKKVIYESKI